MLSWREVLNTFSDDYTVYAFDFLGYGDSDRADELTGSTYFKTHVACVRYVADHFHLTDFALAGLSMGGAVAIGFALTWPERVNALIPVDTWGVSEKMPFHRFSYVKEIWPGSRCSTFSEAQRGSTGQDRTI